MKKGFRGGGKPNRGGGPSRAPGRHPERGPAPRAHQKSDKPRDNARWVIGIHSSEEALKVRPKKVRELWLKEGWASSQQLRALEETAQAAKIQIKEKSPGQLDNIGAGHQGVALALLETPAVDWESLKSAESALVLILDGIED